MKAKWSLGCLLAALAVSAPAQPAPEVFQQDLDRDLAQAEAPVARMEQFVREQAARMDTLQPVSAPDRDQLDQLQSLLEQLALSAPADDPRLRLLQDRVERLKRADASLHAALTLETRPRPDVYAGPDAAALKAAAAAAVTAAHADVVLFRTGLISRDWLEVGAWAWTDEKRTAVQEVAFRFVLAEVAGRVQANAKLFTVELREDRQADGTWGAPQAVIRQAIPALEDNVR